MKKIMIFTCFLVTSVLFSGCYLLQQGTSLLRYQVRSRPVERILADEHISYETREFLKEVRSILDFAVEHLGLDESRNYSTYVEIDRNYLVALVNAAEALSFTDYTWKFPIVGEVPYKGFFNPEHARREQRRLENKGYDTWISAVNAFSTLGYFRDPLYSFMKGYSSYRLSDLLIHELTHSTIWVKDHVRFNEELAVFIGNRGAELYVREKYGEGSPQHLDIFIQREDRRQFSSDIISLKDRLEHMYSLPLPEQEKLAEKDRIISGFQQQFLETYEQRYDTERYLGFAELEVNNAYISINSVYHSTDDVYRRLFEFASDDLALMIDLLRPLEGTRNDPYRYMEEIMAGNL